MSLVLSDLRDGSPIRLRDHQIAKRKEQRSESRPISRGLAPINRKGVLSLSCKLRPRFSTIPIHALVRLAFLVGGKVVVPGLKGDADIALTLAPAAGTLLWNGFRVGLAEDAIGFCAVGPGSGGHRPSKSSQDRRNGEDRATHQMWVGFGKPKSCWTIVFHGLKRPQWAGGVVVAKRPRMACAPLHGHATRLEMGPHNRNCAACPTSPSCPRGGVRGGAVVVHGSGPPAPHRLHLPSAICRNQRVNPLPVRPDLVWSGRWLPPHHEPDRWSSAWAVPPHPTNTRSP